MVFPIHLQRSKVAAILDCPVRGQFIRSRSLKPVAPQAIWLFQESLSEPAKRRLREQYEDIQNWTLCRKNLAILFLGNYYAAIVLTSITGAIAAAMLFYIVKVSISVAWQKNPWAVTLFVTSTALSAFYASFPLLFRQQENLNSNQSDFLALKNLSNATRSYLATGRIEDGSVIDGDAFILRLDKQIKEATNLSISLDPSKKAVFRDF
jgi:hypothetical protein